MKGEKVYLVEKRFQESLRLMGRDDPYIRIADSGKYFISIPHPVEDVEYILCTYGKRNQPREFTELGTCVMCAVDLGADSIRFRLTDGAKD